MNGGGVGILGLYLSPNDILVLLLTMLVVVIIGIAWIIKIIGDAIERRPVVIMDNPSPRYWSIIEELTHRIKYQHDYGDRNDDRYNLLYAYTELDYAKRQHSKWLERDREQSVREAIERIKKQQEKSDAIQR